MTCSLTARRILRRLLDAGLAAGLALSWALATPSPALAAPAPSVDDTAGLEAFLDGVIPRQLEELDIPGAAVAVVHDGRLVLAKGYGFADLESRRKVNAEKTLMRPGSASKPIAWTAVMQLVEQGRIDLDADVNTYLDFRIPEAYGKPVTMRHLLTHTAGFEAVETDLFLLEADRVPGLRDYLVRNLPARVFPPGKVNGYSNYGTALAGYIVQRVSGEPFDLYVERHVFGPLGMTRSTLRQPVPATLAPDVTEGYGTAAGGPVRGDFEFVGPYPAGAANLTVTDMARFMIAHLEGGRYGESRILKPETVETMHARQFSPDPRLDKMAFGFMEREVNGRRLLWHGGATFLHNSGLYLLPGERTGLFVSFNGRAGAAACEELLQAFMDRYHPATGPLPKLTPKAGAAERIGRYAGEYHFTRSEFTTQGKFVRLLSAAQVSASKDGRLLLSAEGKTARYVEVGDSLFRHESRDELLLFETAEDGTVWIHSDGAPSLLPFTATSAFKVPWYQTSAVTALVLLGGLLLFAATLIGWPIRALVARLRHSRRGPASRVPGLVAASFAGMYVLFIVALVSAIADVHPAYGVPKAFVGGPVPLLDAALWLPLLMAPLAAVMSVLALRSWSVRGERGTWRSLAGRVLYTVSSLWALAIVAMLFFWNLVATAA